MAVSKSHDPILLDETTRRKFDNLMLIASKVRAGAMKGERRSIKRGTSIEFADYRNYTPGDDLRRLDWNVYARLERPYIKLLEDEEDLAVHVILDASASMAWPKEGETDHNKLLYAKRLVAGLGYIALVNNDRTMFASVNDAGIGYFGPSRGRAQTVSMLRYVHDVKARGVTDLNLVLKDYALRAGRPGLCIIVSDMFSPSGFLDGINTLLSKGHELVILHTLSPDEVTPPLAGDLRLIDVETEQPQEVSVDETMREIYARRLEAWQTEIRNECARREVTYLPLVTDMPWEKVVLYDLRRLGLIK